MRPVATILLITLCCLPMTGSAQNGDYSALFESLKPALFTVEVVDRASGNKNAQGSAFRVGADGVLATNYHVVSEHVLDPERYALRFRAAGGRAGELEVLAVDVLHDLAVVRMADDPAAPAEAPADESVTEVPVPEEESSEVAANDAPATPAPVFELAENMPADGQTILALGNPYDIGISLVPGTYNGLLESQYRKLIHFTGALNPGMSGGPAVNEQGRVVGINVAGAGNSVSFLVPVARLAELLGRTPDQAPPLERLREGLADRIREHQAEMVDELLAGDWSLEPFGPLSIPREVRPWIGCSGASSEPDSDAPWSDSSSNCMLADRIYLSRSLDTGGLEMMFGWYHSDSLNAFQFARVFSQNNFVPFNRAGEDDVTDYQCVENWTSFPALDPVPFKASFCVRAYLDYPGIHDILFVARAQRPGPEGVFLHYTLAGVGLDTALRFHRKFVGSVAWK